MTGCWWRQKLCPDSDRLLPASARRETLWQTDYRILLEIWTDKLSTKSFVHFWLQLIIAWMLQMLLNDEALTVDDRHHNSALHFQISHRSAQHARDGLDLCCQLGYRWCTVHDQENGRRSDRKWKAKFWEFSPYFAPESTVLQVIEDGSHHGTGCPNCLKT